MRCHPRPGRVRAGTLLLVAVAGFALGGCVEVMKQIQNNPSTRRALTRGLTTAAAAQLPVGDEEERAYGGAVAVQIVARHGGLVEDAALTRYVGSVGLALAGVSTRPALRWHFGVLQSDVPNAWSAPGGYVFITRGMLKLLQSEAELAGVLGHEIAHITRRHAVAIFQNLKSASAMTSAATQAWKTPASLNGLIDKYVEDYLANGMPRDKEFESDSDALTLVGPLGYRKDGLATVLARLETATKPQAGAPSHPDLKQRIARLRNNRTKSRGQVDGKERFDAAMRAAGIQAPVAPVPVPEPAPAPAPDRNRP